MSGQWFPDAHKAVQHLKRRMVEKKRQEPRQKFIEDHQRIHSRKKNEPCIPILPGHDQEEWFAKLDSNGIWNRVFDYLTNPSDVTSAFFACELFRKHLEEKRMMMMLPKVFRVLRDTGLLMYAGPVAVPRREKFGAYPYSATHCLPYLPMLNVQNLGGINTTFTPRLSGPCSELKLKHDAEVKAESRQVLNQRLVSKAWKKAAEEELMVHESLFSRPIRMFPFYWPRKSEKMVCRFHLSENADYALEMLRDTTPESCASLLRHIEVNDDYCKDKATFYSNLEQLLDLHGEAVWAFKFEQARRQGSGYFNYDALRNLVARMPNLKALWVDHHWNRAWKSDDDEEIEGARTNVDVDFREEKARVRASIIQNPFPSLSSLELLNFDCAPWQNEFLLAEILSKCANLKAVNLGDWKPQFGSNNPIPDFVWAELQNLRLEHFSFNYDMRGSIFMHDLFRLQEFDWPLKCFRVHYDCWENYNYENPMKASNIFKALSPFNDTLEEFSFDGFENVLVNNDETSVVVDFPNLKRFELPDGMPGMDESDGEEIRRNEEVENNDDDDDEVDAGLECEEW